MELWIRSQDKEGLIKIKNIEIQHHYSYKDAQEKFLLPSGSFEYRKVPKKDKYIESVIMCNDEICLGKYKSKERALEVLDEMQNHLLKMGENEILTDKIGNMNGIKHYGIVYEMPKD